MEKADVSNVRYISVIRLEGGESIVNIPYGEMAVDSDLIAGFVTAVIIFAKTPIRTIRKANYDILIEVGEYVLVLMVIDPVENEEPYRKKLRRILENLEEKHAEKLEHFEGDIRRFREFSLEILKEFPFYRPNLMRIPVMKSTKEGIPFRVGLVDRKLEQLENYINGKRTVAEIMDQIALSEEEVIALISALAKYDCLEFHRRLEGSDVLEKSDCPEIALRKISGMYGIAEKIMASTDGKKTIDEVISKLQADESVDYDESALWFVIKKIVDAGCLQLVEGSIE
ncbi:MAG: hypothetical protein GF309_16685 [Candidatus Lokiarchaeota archaeon]|nr:hypothetical protein [Candidatus Lokiarchaeota archaeon]